MTDAEHKLIQMFINKEILTGVDGGLRRAVKSLYEMKTPNFFPGTQRTKFDPVSRDHSGVAYLVGDTAACEIPAEGFLTKDKTYTISGLRPEEGRVVVTDDRGLEMWARADRFRIWITGGFKELQERDTECKDCGVKTQPGPGSARCPSCWDDKCGPGYDR